MKKKLLARVLALVMAVSLLSTTALAHTVTIDGVDGSQDVESVTKGAELIANSESKTGTIELNTAGVDTSQYTENDNGSFTFNENALVWKDANVTLDLNGNSIAGTGQNYAVTVLGGSTLTITDDGDGTISGAGKGAINNSGTLNVQGGTIAATGTAGKGIQTTGTTTIGEDATVVGGKGSNGIGVMVSGADASLTTEGDISGYYGVYATKGSTTEITGGNIDGINYGAYAGSNSTITVTDGTIQGGSSGMHLTGGADGVVNGGKIEGSGEVTTNGIAGITVYGPGNPDDKDTWTTLTVNGGKISGTTFGISGNGQQKNWGTTITINGGDISGHVAGIYHPQKGTLIIGTAPSDNDDSTISGNVDPTISGYVGIQICGGDVTIYGGNITATGEGNSSADKNDGEDGVVPDASALSVLDRVGYAGVGSINIYGGNFSAKGNNATFSYEWDNSKPSDQEQTEWPFTGIVGGEYSSEIVDPYLGTIDFSKEPFTDINPTVKHEGNKAQASCYQVVNGDLPYYVGYLTGTGGSVPLLVGEDTTLTPSYLLNGVDFDLTTVTPLVQTWSTESDILTVDEDGNVTAIAAGEATITATLINGETVTFTITVTAEAPDDGNNDGNGEDGTLPGGGITFDGAAGGTTITDDEIPLAGLLTLADLLEELRVYEEIEEIELPEDFQWIDHDLAQAIYWGLDELLVVDTEEDPLDPDELLTVGLMREVLANYVELYKGLEDFEVVLEGEDEDLVMDYMDMIARLGTFYEELEAALEDAAA